MGVVLPKDVRGHCFDDSNLLHSKLAFGVTLNNVCVFTVCGIIGEVERTLSSTKYRTELREQTLHILLCTTAMYTTN